MSNIVPKNSDIGQLGRLNRRWLELHTKLAHIESIKLGSTDLATPAANELHLTSGGVLKLGANDIALKGDVDQLAALLNAFLSETGADGVGTIVASFGTTYDTLRELIDGLETLSNYATITYVDTQVAAVTLSVTQNAASITNIQGNITALENEDTAIGNRIGALTLGSLTDVTLGTVSSGSVLKYNGAVWASSTDDDTFLTTSGSLNAIQIAGASGQLSDAQVFIAGSGGSAEISRQGDSTGVFARLASLEASPAASTLGGLTDVSLGTLGSNNSGGALVYDHSSGEWSAGTISISGMQTSINSLSQGSQNEIQAGDGSGSFLARGLFIDDVTTGATVTGLNLNVKNINTAFNIESDKITFRYSQGTLGGTLTGTASTLSFNGDAMATRSYVNSVAGSGVSVTGNTDQFEVSDGSGDLKPVDLSVAFTGSTLTSIIPTNSEQVDLGSASNKFRHLYLSPNSLFLGDTGVTLTGSTLSVGGAALAKASALNALETTVTNVSTTASGNTSSISTNTTNIGANTSNISTNSTSISVNSSSITSILSDVSSLSSSLSSVNSSISGFQTEIDATQTGAGLNTDGTYSANTAATFINSATSLKNADTLLNNQLAIVTSDLASLQSTDLTDTATLLRTTDTGTDIGDLITLVNVSSSAGLPAVDASQLTGITATQVGALADLTNESLNSLTDVDYTAGSTIDGYVLTYNHTNTQWEAQQRSTTVLLDSTNVTQVSGSNRAEVSVSPGTTYIIDESAASVQFVNSIVFVLSSANVDDPSITKIINLTSLNIYVYISASNRLFDALGNAATSGSAAGKSGFFFLYSKGTVNLYQSDITSNNAKWYAYFDYPINQSLSTSEGDGIAYSTRQKAYINAGHSYGDYLVTADIASSAGLYSARKYVTAFDESTNRTISIGNAYDHLPIVESLDGSRIFFENRGSANLILSADSGPFVGGIYYYTHFWNFDGSTGQSSSKTLLPGESAVIEFEYDTSNASEKRFKLKYQLLGHAPSRVVETDSSGTNTTITSGTEHQKVFKIDNGSNSVTITLSEGSGLRSGYLLDLKVLGSGAVTVQRSGSETIDADTSLTLSQYQTLRLINTSTGWSILQKYTSATVNNLTDLTDVSFTAGSGIDNYVLTYDHSAGTWGAEAGVVVNDASVTQKGIIEIATDGEATSASANDKALVPSNIGVIALSSFNDDLGSVYQALDTGLTSISGLTTSADKMIYTTASDTYAVADLTTAGRALLDDANAEAQRTTLGLGTAATSASTDFLASTAAINDLSDVTITSASTSEYLRYSGSAWVDASLSIADDASPMLGGDLDLNGNDLITTSNANLELAPNGTGVVVLKGNTNSGSIKFNCESNTHGVTLKGPAHSAGATYTLTLPTTDGTPNQVLKTDGSGVLDWVDQASGSGGWTYSAITADPADAQVGYHYSCGAGNESFTVTLPSASGTTAGEEIRIKNMGTGTITIDPGLDSIDASSTDFVMDTQFSSITLVSNGTSGWEIV